MCDLGSDGVAALLSECQLVHYCSHHFVFPCLEVLFYGQFVRSAAMPVVVDSLHISYADMFIWQMRAVGGSPRAPMPAHRRGCLLECDHPPYGGHDPTTPQAALPKQSVHTAHTGKTIARQDIGVGYFLLPECAQDTADVTFA